MSDKKIKIMINQRQFYLVYLTKIILQMIKLHSINKTLYTFITWCKSIKMHVQYVPVSTEAQIQVPEDVYIDL